MAVPTPPAPASRRQPRRRAAAGISYDESLIDVSLRDHLSASPQSSRRRHLISPAARQKETETEAMIAFSLGFPIDELLEAEKSTANVEGKEGRNEYVVVRNHVLASWRLDVRSWLSKEHIKATVASQYDQLVSSAHDFLSLEGYINFGVGPTFPLSPPPPLSPSVLVIGAGLAGLAAARQLIKFGLKVLVLEGRARAGGRVFTYRTDGKSLELGGSVITGLHANPLGVLARQMGVPLHAVRDKCPLYLPDGTEIDADTDKEADFVFNNLLEHAARLREFLGKEDDLRESISLGSALEKLRKLYGAARNPMQAHLLNWHMANLEYANAGSLADLSLAHWDQDDAYEMGGDHCLLAGGNGRLVDALREGVPVLYGKKAVRVAHGAGGVRVEVEGGQAFEADVALCTVPLGVLKKNAISFDPALPPRKLSAISSLGFGLLNKVAMVFPSVFWGEDLDTFGRVSEERRKRGEFFLFYGYQAVAGGAVLVALVAGEAAEAFEREDAGEAVGRVLGILRGIYGRKGVTVPDPIESVCTRWGGDPFSHGSYSHVRVGSSGADYDALAESVSGRLFFAGEATSRQYPATMHGAFLSGLREAAKIVRSVEKCDVGGDLGGKRSLGVGGGLVGLFEEPDLGFGGFEFVFVSGEGEEREGIMRVSFREMESENGGKCSSAKEEFHLYAIVSRKQAREMQLQNGDDKTKLEFLYCNYNVKLMGFNSTCDVAGSLIVSILNARKGQNRLRRQQLSNKIRI